MSFHHLADAAVDENPATVYVSAKLHEANPIAVGVANVKVKTAPRLAHESLRETHASALKLREQRLGVRNFDQREYQPMLSLRQDGKVWFAYKTQVQPGTVTRYRSVERWIAVQKVNAKAQFLLVKSCGARYVAHE